MKKVSLILASSALLLLVSGCGGGDASSLTRSDISFSSDISSGAEESGSSSAKPVTVDELTPDRYGEFLPNFFAKKKSFDSYQAITEGKTSSIVEQSIDVTLIRNKEYGYLKNHSKSWILETTHICYYHENNALYNDNGEKDYHLASIADYLAIYGVYPFEDSLEGYLCSDGMILSIEKEQVEGPAKFTFNFDPDKATNNVRIQMKAFGQLDAYPVFSYVKVTVAVQNDFTPISIDVDAKYKAKKIIDNDCHQTYTVTYSRFNEDIEIPDLDKAKSHEGF